MDTRKLITVLRRRWRYRHARTVADLANLIAGRHAKTHPPHRDGQVMRDALVALGRAGFVVVNAEQGGPSISLPDGLLTRRAAVTAFASTETWDRLDDVLYRAFPSYPNTPYGLRVYELFAPGRQSHAEGCRQPGITIERLDGVERRRIGTQMDPDEVRELFPVRAGVRDELHNGWLVTLCAHAMGRSDLFPFLLDAVTDRLSVRL